MTLVLLALGLVLAFEGLVLALLPGRLDEIVALIAGLSRERRRAIGLGMLVAGVAILWLVLPGSGL